LTSLALDDIHREIFVTIKIIARGRKHKDTSNGYFIFYL
jgi:hypothetical protein